MLPAAAAATMVKRFTAGNAKVIAEKVESADTFTGNDLFSLSARVSRVFTVSRVRFEALVETFNLTNRRNVLTRNTTFGTGMYPSNPLPSFDRSTAVGDPRAVQLGVRVGF